MNPTFTCGHTQESEPRFMGRGQARVKRLAEYFARPCFECASASLQARLASLTDMQGTSRPATSEVVAAKTDKLRRTY
jgi:hypothetical protein